MDDKRAEQKIEEIQNLLGCCHAVEYDLMGECTQSGEPERCDARPDMTFLLDALEAAQKENEELRAALEEVRDSKVCWDWDNDEVAHWTEVDGNVDSFVAPHLAAWLRQQEVQG